MMMASVLAKTDHRRRRGVAVLVAMALSILHAACTWAAPPALPSSFVDSTYSTPAGQTIVVEAGGDLQAAIDRAERGDVIELAAGYVYRGPFELPSKEGDGWVTIRSGQYHEALPSAGTRVTDADRRAMPVLMAWPGPVISALAGASHYRFIGVEIRGGAPTAANLNIAQAAHAAIASLRGTQAQQSTLVDLSSHGGGAADMPHHIIFDRSYLQGAEDIGTRRGIAMNAAHIAVLDSHLSGFVSTSEDSQAIAGWDGPGPYRIINNYLEAAGENLMFGGADPAVPDRVPSDIEIRGNHFAKPRAWRLGDSLHDGSDWSVKNLLELKNARRVLIEGNLFEYNWPAAQSGFAILFTVRNQDGRAEWSVVEDVTFRSNIVQHVAAGINILGWDDIHDSRQTSRILIENNLFLDVGGEWGNGRLFQLLNGTVDVHIRNNTAIQQGRVLVVEGAVHEGFVFSRNILLLDEPAITGTGTAPGQATLEHYFSGFEFSDNILLGEAQYSYPADNHFHPSLHSFGFVDPDAADYRVKAQADAPSDNNDYPLAGVDFGLLCSALSISEAPSFC